MTVLFDSLLFSTNSQFICLPREADFHFKLYHLFFSPATYRIFVPLYFQENFPPWPRFSRFPGSPSHSSPALCPAPVLTFPCCFYIVLSSIEEARVQPARASGQLGRNGSRKPRNTVYIFRLFPKKACRIQPLAHTYRIFSR